MLGVAASNSFYYVAIQKTSVAIAIIVQYTAPIWVLLYVVARGQQKLSLQKVAAVGVAVAGIALTIGIVGGKPASALHFESWGFLAALLASFSFAFYNVGGHRILARHDRWRVLVWTNVFSILAVCKSPWRSCRAQRQLRGSTLCFPHDFLLGRSRSTSSGCSIRGPPMSPVV
jgi:drug/metabolite transporter (DMT)-like permease